MWSILTGRRATSRVRILLAAPRSLAFQRRPLRKWKVPEGSVNEMEKLINNGKHYQLACIEYFKCGHHGNDGDGVGNTPNDFFRESCRHYVKKKEKEAGAV